MTRPTRRIHSMRTSLLAGACVCLGLPIAHVGAEPAGEVEMAPGAFFCKSIDPAMQHAEIVNRPTPPGTLGKMVDDLRAYVEAQTGSGDCRVVQAPELVNVVDVDQRGFALVADGEKQRWWTSAENVWILDTMTKLKAWKKR